MTDRVGQVPVAPLNTAKARLAGVPPCFFPKAPSFFFSGERELPIAARQPNEAGAGRPPGCRC